MLHILAIVVKRKEYELVVRCIPNLYYFVKRC